LSNFWRLFLLQYGSNSIFLICDVNYSIYYQKRYVLLQLNIGLFQEKVNQLEKSKQTSQRVKDHWDVFQETKSYHSYGWHNCFRFISCTKRKMPQVKKYPREKLFLEYLTDEEESVFKFLKKKGIVKPDAKGQTGSRAESTKWRCNKKQEFKKKAMEKALKSLESKVADKIYKPSIELLSEMHEKIMKATSIAVEELTVKTDEWKEVTWFFFDKRIKDLWEIVKVEKKEPTRYIEDLTPNIHVELNDKQKEVLDKFKKLKSKW